MLKQFHASIPLRFFASNPSGYRFQVDGYIEVKENDGSGGSRILLASLDSKKEGPYSGQDIGQPYSILSAIQRKRFEARNMNTTYVYDFPDLFSTAIQQLWLAYPAPPVNAVCAQNHNLCAYLISIFRMNQYRSRIGLQFPRGRRRKQRTKERRRVATRRKRITNPSRRKASMSRGHPSPKRCGRPSAERCRGCYPEEGRSQRTSASPPGYRRSSSRRGSSFSPRRSPAE